MPNLREALSLSNDAITQATAPSRSTRPTKVGRHTILRDRLVTETPRFSMPKKDGLTRVTPELAEDFLRRNVLNNRDLNERFIEQLIRLMSTGLFVDNGDTIRFTNKGNLIDGQHRLLACVASGNVLWLYVRLNLDVSAYPTIDTGNKRQAWHHLAREGMPWPTALQAAARLALTEREGGSLLNTRYQPSHQEIMDFVHENPTMVDITGVIQGDVRLRKLLRSAASTIYLAWRVRGIDEARGKAFIETLSSGSNLNDGSPILLARNILTLDPTNAKRRKPIHLLALCVKAWNAVITGKHPLRLLWGGQDASFPKFAVPSDPLIEVDGNQFVEVDE